MRTIMGVVAAALLLGGGMSAVAHADARQKGKKQAKQERAAPAASGTSVAVQVVFSTGDVRIVREHYAPRYRNLPPGLQKKYARTGQLPPGWQKKLEPFPVALERRLTPLPSGYQRGVIDGHAVIYNTRSHVIFDVAVLY